VLELFHGPTAAFKDVGAGFLAACMQRLEADAGRPLEILVATSGDAWWTARMEAGRDKLIGLLDRITARRVFDISLERMTDWEAMRIHVYRDEQVARRVMQRYKDLGVMTMEEAEPDNPFTGTTLDPFVTARATETYFETRSRSQITMEQVLRHLGYFDRLRGHGSQRRGPCPVHGTKRARGRTFSVHLGKDVFQCFHPPCGAAGNALDLWCAIHHLTPYEGARHLAETFDLQLTRNTEKQEPVMEHVTLS